MRKSVLVLTTVFAIASGSAFALGDRAKEKKPASSSATTSSQATENPSGSGAANTTKGMQSTPSSTSATLPGSSSSSISSSSGVTDKKSQVAQNDARCDESKYASKSAMPKECTDKSGTGASAVGSTQGQSGGAAASGGPSSSSTK